MLALFVARGGSRRAAEIKRRQRVGGDSTSFRLRPEREMYYIPKRSRGFQTELRQLTEAKRWVDLRSFPALCLLKY